MTPLEAGSAVAFCGLGRMGTPMARRVAEAGFAVAAWNRSPGSAVSLAAGTAVRIAPTPAGAAAGAAAAITMVTDGDALHALLDGPDGLLAGLAPGAVLIDCSTVGAEAARAAAAVCAARGVGFVDAPVSGSTAVAAKGELAVMAGGSVDDVERVRPLLDAFSSHVVHVGGVGAGAATKVAVNGLLHGFNAALAESLVAAEAAGVAPSRLFDVLAVSVLSNRYVDYKRAAYVDPGAAAVAFDLATAAKDLRLAAAASAAAGIPSGPVADALRTHETACAQGYGARDISALAEWFRSQPGGGPSGSPDRSGEDLRKSTT